jgi:hypothetical protein
MRVYQIVRDLKNIRFLQKINLCCIFPHGEKNADNIIGKAVAFLRGRPHAAMIPFFFLKKCGSLSI